MKDTQQRQSTSSSERSEKRQKDQMSITIFGIVVYSIALVLVIAGSFIGFKTLFSNHAAKKAAEQAAIEELERANLEAEEQKRLEEERAEEERKKAEEEAKQKEAKEEEKDSEEEYQDTVFSVIENPSDPKNALINTFYFTRKLTGSGDEKVLDYDIYTDPETKQIKKISTREDCGDLFEITDYYYDNGAVNYIAQYKDDVDLPVDLSGADIESRCYFNNKKMVRYIYCENGKATEYTKADFPAYSDGTRDQYDYIENMMAELAENVYKNVDMLKEEVKISGYILDEYDQVLKDNYVALVDDTGKVVRETYTDGDGHYEFTVAADDNKEYAIDASRDTMIEAVIHGIKVPKGSKKVYANTLYMCYEQLQEVYPVQLFVKDADDFNVPLSGAQIRLRYGINNTSGESFMTGILGAAGECMPQLRSGNYTAEISKEGYETSYASFNVKPNKLAAMFYAVKELADDEYKCVLSFETTPLDLDLRAYNSYGRTLYKSKNDSVGGTSAETIDIKDAGTDVYPVYVSNYADIMAPDNFSYRLSGSNARLSVYNSEGLMGVYPVPEAHAGILWKPLELRNGKVVLTNDFYTNVSDKSDFRQK